MTALLLLARRYWRVLAIAAAAALILYAISHVINKAEARGYERAQAEMAARVATANAATAAREAEEREISRAHDFASLERTRALQSQIDGLTARNVDLGRLQGCAGRRVASAAGKTSAAPVIDGGASRAEHDLPTRGDLGIGLVRYAGTCEQYRQQLIGLQAWFNALQ